MLHFEMQPVSNPHILHAFLACTAGLSIVADLHVRQAFAGQLRIPHQFVRVGIAKLVADIGRHLTPRFAV